jgi:hypothetical protein
VCGAREARRAPEAPAQVTIGTILPQLNHYPDFTSNIYSGSVTGVYFDYNFSPMALQNKSSWLWMRKKSVYLMKKTRIQFGQKSAQGSKFSKFENTFYFFSRKRKI